MIVRKLDLFYLGNPVPYIYKFNILKKEFQGLSKPEIRSRNTITLKTHMRRVPYTRRVLPQRYNYNNKDFKKRKQAF